MPQWQLHFIVHLEEYIQTVAYVYSQLIEIKNLIKIIYFHMLYVHVYDVLKEFFLGYHIQPHNLYTINYIWP